LKTCFLHTPCPLFLEGSSLLPAFSRLFFYLLALPPYLIPLISVRTGMTRTLPSIKRGLRGVFLFSFPSITTAFIQKNLLVPNIYLITC